MPQRVIAHVIQFKRIRWHGVFQEILERWEYSSPNFKFYTTPREPFQARHAKLEVELGLMFERIHVGLKIMKVFVRGLNLETSTVVLRRWTRPWSEFPSTTPLVQPRTILSTLVKPVSNTCISAPRRFWKVSVAWTATPCSRSLLSWVHPVEVILCFVFISEEYCSKNSKDLNVCF